MARVITVTANPLLDHLAEAVWQPGKVTRVPRIARIAGGKGVNVARVLARHGHQVVATGFAGGDEGRALASLVAEDGIEPAFVPTAARLRIGFQVADPRATTAVIEDGFAVASAEADALIERIRALLPADLVIISGSVPDVALRDLFRRICDLVPCWVDAYGAPMLAALAGANPPLLAKPNRQEYGEDPQPWLTCRELHLTDGAASTTVRSPEGRFRVIPPVVAEINPIGSGDCYLAGLAHGQLSGWPLPRRLAWAAAAGAANAARADVARIGPEDIRPLVEAVMVTPAP
jgi:fructose-1-phosphate kinase PfkB-like protein